MTSDNEMTNQAAQTMPSIATLPFVTVEQVQRYRAESLRVEAHRNELLNQAAALSQPEGVAEGWMRDVADAAASLDKRGDRQMAARLMRLHRDMLAAAPAASGGEVASPSLKQIVPAERRNYLDDNGNPHSIEDEAYSLGWNACRSATLKAIANSEASPKPPSAASVSERETISLDLNNLPAEWPWDEGSPCLDPRPVGMVYPAVPTPRAFGYLDKTGVEWAAYDTGQMEEYGRRAFADGANTALRAIEHALSSPRQEGECPTFACQRARVVGWWNCSCDECKARREANKITTPRPGAEALRTVIASMSNFADVADKCELTEGNAPTAIRSWITQLESLLTSPTTGADGESTIGRGAE